MGSSRRGPKRSSRAFWRAHRIFAITCPAVADGLNNYPQAELPSAESFLYWSKEQYENGKPVIAVTQVHIVRPVGPSLPVVAVLGQEVFASHYRDGSLGTTFVLEGGKTRYLVVLEQVEIG